MNQDYSQSVQLPLASLTRSKNPLNHLQRSIKDKFLDAENTRFNDFIAKGPSSKHLEYNNIKALRNKK